MAKHILVIGGDSYIATMLCDMLAHVGHDITITSRHHKTSPYPIIHYDILHDDDDFDDYDVVIFLVAQSNKKFCQENLEISQNINVDIPMKLCHRFARQGSHCILFSTCEVTGGITPFADENAAYNPKSIYAEHKMRLEQSALSLQQTCSHITILRLTKIYDECADFIKNWQLTLQQKQKLSLFDDIMIAPLERQKLCAIMVKIINKKLSGLYNISGNEEYSYYHFAKKILGNDFDDYAHITPIICDEETQQKLLLCRHNSLCDDKLKQARNSK